MNYKKYRKKLPPYGKIISKIRKDGKVPWQIVMIVLSWNLAKVYPRLVLPDDTSPDQYDFSCLAGIPVQIAYHNKDANKVDTLVNEVLKMEPSFLFTLGLDLLNTGKASQIIKPLKVSHNKVALCK